MKAVLRCCYWLRTSAGQLEPLCRRGGVAAPRVVARCDLSAQSVMRRTNSNARLGSIATSEGPPAGDAFMACPICFEVYTTGGSSAPRVLDCAHSFCEGCITRWIEVAPAAAGQIQGARGSCPGRVSGLLSGGQPVAARQHIASCLPVQKHHLL